MYNIVTMVYFAPCREDKKKKKKDKKEKKEKKE